MSNIRHIPLLTFLSFSQNFLSSKILRFLILVKSQAGDIIYMVRSYCMNFYGCELWNIATERRAFHQLCVAYHSCIKKLVRVPKSSRNHPLCLALGILPCPMLVASRQIPFYKQLLSSGNNIIRALLASDIGTSGITARSHLALRQEYRLMGLDLTRASPSSIRNVFIAHLRRFVNNRNDCDIGRLLHQMTVDQT